MHGLRILLYPFSVIYDGITRLRNWAFDYKILQQNEFAIPIVAIGNLSTGGTGKTPMIEYLVRQHSGRKVAVLSRGYGRKTKGFIEVTETHLAIEVGDEPLQLKSKFKDNLVVAVCEKRTVGIEELMKSYSLDLILLDDAYQHRYIKASQYILLSSHDKPYYEDYLLPAGNLRESRSGADRANFIVITKCPEDLDQGYILQTLGKIKPTVYQKVYFSTISYDTNVYGADESIELTSLRAKKIVVIAGIAKPIFFTDHLQSKQLTFDEKIFADHYNYKTTDVDNLSNYDAILTTEKDYARLKKFDLENLYYLPIKTTFIGDQLEINISDN